MWQLKRRKTKTCKQCGTKLPLEEFYHHPETKDKRLAVCKRCKIERVKARYWEKKLKDGLKIAKGDPIVLYMPEKSIRRVNQYALTNDIACFTEAFEMILKAALDQKTCLKLNAFDWALSVLNDDRVELLAIVRNLNQLYQLASLGWAGVAPVNLEAINGLINATATLLSSIDTISRSIKSNQPTR